MTNWAEHFRVLNRLTGQERFPLTKLFAYVELCQDESDPSWWLTHHHDTRNQLAEKILVTSDQLNKLLRNYKP